MVNTGSGEKLKRTIIVRCYCPGTHDNFPCHFVARTHSVEKGETNTNDNKKKRFVRDSIFLSTVLNRTLCFQLVIGIASFSFPPSSFPTPRYWSVTNCPVGQWPLGARRVVTFRLTSAGEYLLKLTPRSFSETRY